MAEDQASGRRPEAEFTAEVALPQAEDGPCLKIKVVLPLEGPERGRQGSRDSPLQGKLLGTSPLQVQARFVLSRVSWSISSTAQRDLTEAGGTGQLELS